MRHVNLFRYMSNNVTSLHQILLDEPTGEVSEVTVSAIEKRAISSIEQIHCVACSQSEGGAQGNTIPTSASRLASSSNTNIFAVYLKIDLQILGIVFFNSGELKMINSRYWNREDPRRLIKRIAFVDSRHVKSNYGKGLIKI